MNANVTSRPEGVNNEFFSAIYCSFFSCSRSNDIPAEWFGIINQAVAARELIEHGAPTNLVPFLMVGARTLEVVAGLSLALGIYPRVAAVALLIFLIPATFVAHQFWQVVGTASFSLQLLNFSKNTAMTGGLLLIAATQFQPTLLPHTSQSDGRERTKHESASRDSMRVA